MEMSASDVLAELKHEPDLIYNEESDAMASGEVPSNSFCTSNMAETQEEMVIKEEQETIESHSALTLSQSKKKVYSCKYCGQESRGEKTLQKHEEAHRNGTIYKCRYCNYHSVSRAFMEGHESRHTGDKRFKCDYCDHRTCYEVDMKKHRRVHFDDRDHKCPLCPFTSKWKGGISKHLSTHSTERDFACHLCDARFKRKSGLKTHLTVHSSYKPFKCDICDYTCRIRSMLQMHLRTHSDVRKYACKYPGCSQKCKTKSDLTKHEKVHSETLDFACNQCGKEFKTRHSLACHIQRHVEKTVDFTCSICQRKLSTRFGLRKHITQHLVGKRHACPICGHKFHTKGNMRLHMRVHATGRKYRCPICKFNGNDVNDILVHIGSAHAQDYTYLCDTCKKPFSSIQRIKQHVGRCHSETKCGAGALKFDFNQHYCQSSPEIHPSQSSSSSSIIESSQSSSEEYMQENLNSSMEDINGSSAEESSNLPSSVNILSDSQESEFASSLGIKEELVDRILSNSTTDLSEVLPMETDSLANSNSMAEIHSISQDNGGLQPHEELSQSLNGKDKDPVTACLKSLVVQLERLPKADPSLSIFLETTSPNEERVSDTTKVINIGSVGGVDVCLVGKNSGVILNLDKKGKKVKKWYMTTELASSVKTAGKVRKSQSKNLSPLAGSSRKLGKCTSRKNKKGVVRKKSRSVGRPVGSRKKIENLVIKLSQSGKSLATVKKKTPVNKSRKKNGSGKSRSRQDTIEPVLFNSMSEKGPNMSRNKENPRPVNFDVIVKCERLNLDELNQVSLRRSDVSDKMACSSFEASTTASTVSLSGLNPTLTASCDRSKVKRISDGKKKKRKSVYGKRQQSKALDKYTFETLNMEALVMCEQLHPSVLNDIRVLEKKTKRKSDTPSTNNDQEVTRKKSKKAKSKSLAKGNVEKDDKEEDFVEESLYVEEIMDSPFQITWKTMRRSGPNGTSQTTNHQSNSTTISSVDDLNANGIAETKSHQQTNTMATAMDDCNSSRFKGPDAKPNCPTPSLSSDIACKKPCSVRVEDIGHVFSQSLSREDGKDPKEKSDFLPQAKESVDLPRSTHTISLNEFEKEYRKKKKVIAKFKVMETPSICSTYSSLERPCPEEDQRQGLVFNDEGVSEICSLKSSKVSFNSQKSNSSVNRVRLKQCKVRLDPSAAMQSKLNEVNVSFPEALVPVPVRPTKSGMPKNRKANAVSSKVIPTNLLIGGNSQWMIGGTISPPKLKESQPKNIRPKTKVRSPKSSIPKGQGKQTTTDAAISLHQQSLDLPSKQTKRKPKKIKLCLVGSPRLSSSLTQKRQNNETVDADVSSQQTLINSPGINKSPRKRSKNCEDSPSGSLKKQRLSQSKSDKSTSKTSPKKRAKLYINSLALFGGGTRSWNKHEEKASAKDSWNRKKNSLSDKSNCISFPSSEDIVNLWRMAFECMTGKSTVKLVDCRRKFALSKSMALASPSIEHSRETDAPEYRLLVVSEGEKNSASSGDSVFISHDGNVNSEEDMSVTSKEIDSHSDNISVLQQDEVSPVIKGQEQLVKELPSPSLEGQEVLSNFEEIQKQDVSKISVTSRGKEYPHSSSTDAQKNMIVIDTCTESREVSFPILFKTSSEITKTNLTMSSFKESRPSISMQEFIQANEDHLCKLFPSCQTQLTHEEVLSHLNHWKQLPLPKDFTMGKSGSIRRHSPESCTNNAPISMSTDANPLKESENTQLSVGLGELFSCSEEAENGREATSTTETSMESQTLTIAGQIDTSNPQTGFISLQVAVHVHTHEMNKEGHDSSANNDLTVSEPTNIEAEDKKIFPNILPDPKIMQTDQTPQPLLDPILCLSREETMSSADLNRFPPIANHDPLPMPMDISSCSESEQSSQIVVSNSQSQSPSLFSSVDLVKEELLSVSPHLEFCADDVDLTQDISSHTIPFESEVLSSSDDIFMPDELFSFNVLEPGVDIP